MRKAHVASQDAVLYPRRVYKLLGLRRAPQEMNVETHQCSPSNLRLLSELAAKLARILSRLAEALRQSVSL
jgi:hypothetical protein